MKSEEISLFVIEDDDIDFLTIQRSLKKKRIANPIVRATDGKDALDKLVAGEVPEPFIILLDLQMPRISGHEFLNIIRNERAYERFKTSVVFVLSTSSDEQDIMLSYKGLIAGYFIKEHTGDGFLNIIEMLDGYWKIVHLPVRKNSLTEK